MASKDSIHYIGKERDEQSRERNGLVPELQIKVQDKEGQHTLQAKTTWDLKLQR
jgi:hypothetical protein